MAKADIRASLSEIWTSLARGRGSKSESKPERRSEKRESAERSLRAWPRVGAMEATP